MKPINVLSLFDGISCGQVALERAGIPVNWYMASEIDKYAIQVTQKNYPNTIQVGDVRNVRGVEGSVDLLMGGSPCQGFSFAGKQLNFSDPRSALFFEFVRVLKECKPRWFLLENVKMKKEYQDVISGFLGVEPVKINSALVSAQNRARLYWFNFKIPHLCDKGVRLKHIIMEPRKFKVYSVNKNKRVKGINENNRGYRPHRGDYKVTGISELGRIMKNSACKTDAVTSSHPPKIAVNADILKLKYRWASPVECERLQTLPDDYTKGLSNTQRYKCLGNGWTVDVIAHIFKGLKGELDV